MLSTQLFLIFSVIVEMMVFGFALLFYIFRRKKISPRNLFTILGAIVAISGAGIAVSARFFWNFPAYLSIVIFIIPALTLVLAFQAGKDDVEWRNSHRYSIPVISAILFYELSMGFFYGSAFLPHGLGILVITVSNPDFSIMMFIDAVFFFMISENRQTKVELAILTFAISMSLMPSFYFTMGKAAILTSAILSAAMMVINVILIYILQMRKKEFRSQATALSLASMDLLMMLGLASYVLNGDLATLSLVMIVSMAVYFLLVTMELSNRIVTKDRAYSFALLLMVNAAEIVMSFAIASLGFSITNSMFSGSPTGSSNFFSTLKPGLVTVTNFNNPMWWLFPFDPAMMSKMAFHIGLGNGLPFAYFWTSFMSIMMTTMSPFYAIMMGSEMSYLVLDRYRTTHKKSVRNWALAIIAGIPVFVILIPFYTPFFVFGMSGMIFAVPLALFAVSVIALIIASILLGRRVQCNLVCMAAHMWTNSYYDQFHASRDHNRLWSAVRWISFSVMLLSFVVYSLQSFGFMGPVRLGTVMVNPLDFYGMFVLNYVWWFLFFTTPVFGTYSCARQGWCGFGTLAGLFNKFFFKIKAVDQSICQSCETKSCEPSCPTAIPIRHDIMQKGYTNRISCVGCGNCVESCDFENLNAIDIRNYVKIDRANPKRTS